MSGEGDQQQHLLFCFPLFISCNLCEPANRLHIRPHSIEVYTWPTIARWYVPSIVQATVVAAWYLTYLSFLGRFSVGTGWSPGYRISDSNWSPPTVHYGMEFAADKVSSRKRLALL
jgi:hypothetical protein